MKNNIYIRNEGFSISDEEISEYMDFQQVLEDSKQTNSPFPLKSLAGWLLILAIATALFIIRQPKQPSESVSHPNLLAKDSILLKNDEPAENTSDTTKQMDVTSPEPPSNEETPGNQTIQPTKESRPVTKKESPDPQTDQSKVDYEIAVEDDVIFIKAEPQGGVSKLYEYFDDQLVYPTEAANTGISSQTLVTFTIFKDGSIGEIMFETSLGEPFDKEVTRVLKAMPPWNPATVNGQPVNSKISIPLYFTKP